jgi:BlaI family penicillinase repressor
MAGFTEGELEVMGVLWESERPLKPVEIEKRFARPVGNAALRSMLLVLLEKGHVDREKRGKAYFYKAATPRESEFRRRARRLAKMFCGGSYTQLIAQLIKSEKLSDADLAELRRIAGNAPGAPSAKPGVDGGETSAPAFPFEDTDPGLPGVDYDDDDGEDDA